MSNPETQKFRDMEEALRDLLFKGSIDRSIYDKGMVKLAYEWAQVNDVNETVRVLTLCEPNYFEAIQPQQIEDDQEYGTLAYNLILFLIQNDAVPYLGVRPSTQPNKVQN